MGIINRLGLKIWGNYCFYVIKPNTAVVVGVRHKNGQSRPIPKRIGRYTVRGIHRIHKLPQYAPTLQQLNDKQREALRKKLDPFHQPVFGSLEQLPDTVEYVGYHLDVNGQTKSVPNHIRYIDTLVVYNSSITLPSDLLYLGKIETQFTDSLRSISFYGKASGTQPHLPASSYLGAEVEAVPQIADGAFANCKSLHTVHLSSQLQTVGANLFWEKRITHNLPVDIGYIPTNLRRVEGDALACCRVETVHYPSGIHEEMRNSPLRLHSINRLIIDDLTGLEEYTALVNRGNAPQRHPGACLYHLLRAAKRVQINSQMTRIPDGMFRDCKQLFTLSINHPPYSEIVELNREITAIGAEAFQNCTSIKCISTFQLIQSIGDRAFMGCDIIHFSVYGLVRSIGREAFSQCASLRTLRLHSRDITIGEDAFLGCDKLELSPDDRNRIAEMPCFQSYLAIEEKRNVIVNDLLKKGDLCLRRKPLTLDAKKSAFGYYCSALQCDHHRMEIMNKIEALLLDYQIPLRIGADQLSIIKSNLQEHKSDAMLAALNSTLRSLDDVSVILCASGDIPSVVLAFAINHNPDAAMLLSEFFCDMVKRHAQASGTARGTLCDIMNALLSYCTKQSLQQRIMRVRNECQSQKGHSALTKQRYDITLSGDGEVEQILRAQHFRKLYDKAAEQSAAKDAALWADIVKSLDPGQTLPKVKPRPRAKQQSSAPSLQTPISQIIPLWVPTVPEPVVSIPPSKPVRYIGDETEEEFNRRTSQLISDYNAEQEAARIAREIEDSMYSPPGTYGGY